MLQRKTGFKMGGRVLKYLRERGRRRKRKRKRKRERERERERESVCVCERTGVCEGGDPFFF